jgi:hypothetical protein
MGANNYLAVESEGGSPYFIQFSWGHRREVVYRLGDRLDWVGAVRPARADGIVLRTGLSYEPGRPNAPLRYYLIKFIDDVIAGLDEIEEWRFEAAEKREDLETV